MHILATYPALVSLMISKLANVEYTLTTHAHDIFLDKTLLKEKIENAKAVATISEYNRKYIANHCGDHVLPKIHVIHCGLDISEWKYNDANKSVVNNTIVCVGRLTEMKGFEFLIDACHSLKGRVNFKCHIVGDGHLRERFEKKIELYGLSDKVFIEGVLDSAQVRELIESANIFIVPSIWNDEDGQDGIPLVLMESIGHWNACCGLANFWYSRVGD